MENNVKKLLKKARDRTPSGSTYMVGRVLAEVRSRRSKRRLWIFTALSGVVGAVLASVLIISVSSNINEVFSAETGRPYVVQLEVEHLKNSDIMEAEIILAQGIIFHSEEYAELKERRSLVFQWPNNYKGDVFPFVIKGEIDGTMPVKVRFYNQDGGVIEERELLIKFEKSVG